MVWMAVSAAAFFSRQGLASWELEIHPAAHISQTASSAILELGESPQSGGHSVTELFLQAELFVVSENLPSAHTSQKEFASADGGASP